MQNREQNNEVMKSAIVLFESLDKSFRKKNAQKYYEELSRIALRLGKIKLAKSYARERIEYLIELKEIPGIQKTIDELAEKGLVQKKEFVEKINIILGHPSKDAMENLKMSPMHPELWRESKEAIVQHLSEEAEWGKSQWKLAYECILNFHYDKNLFLILFEKVKEFKEGKFKNLFNDFFITKKINVNELEKNISVSEKEISKKLNYNYDQMALEVIAGNLEVTELEQKKIIHSLGQFSEGELKKEGRDMAIAFSFLGMEKVVLYLCQKIISHTTEVKEKRSLQFLMVQVLHESGEYYKAIDLVSDICANEVLLQDEILAFKYIKAESFFKIKNFKKAKELFLKIKERQPHYRMVEERLRYIEKIK